MAKANPLRFSTKYQDDETDLIYYGYRHYNASIGRWLNRDLIGESAGPNLYCLVGNDVPNKIDALGQWELKAGDTGGALMATTIKVKVKVTNVRLGSIGPTPPYKAKCCCALGSADSSVQVTIWIPIDPNAPVYVTPGLYNTVLQHEIVHATGDERFAPIAIAAGLDYLKNHCMTRWLPGLTWTREACMKAQQNEVNALSSWVEDQAYGPLARMAHRFIGAYPKDWNPAGIPLFYNALDEWIKSTITSDKHFW
jgi:RHS repeat-associated protein